jgi:hypothetical protein
MNQVHVLDMMDLGNQVVERLGSGYRVCAHPRQLTNCVILRSDQKFPDTDFGVLLVHKEGDKKIQIKGLYPRARDGREFPDIYDQPSTIQVKDTKKPHLIAKDINEKFLPEYIQVFKQALEKTRDRNAYLDRRKELADRFACLVHGKVLESGDRVSGGPSVFSSHDNRGYLSDLYVNASDNTVNLNLCGIPADLAATMIEIWLRGWSPPSPGTSHRY